MSCHTTRMSTWKSLSSVRWEGAKSLSCVFSSHTTSSRKWCCVTRPPGATSRQSHSGYPSARSRRHSPALHAKSDESRVMSRERPGDTKSAATTEPDALEITSLSTSILTRAGCLVATWQCSMHGKVLGVKSWRSELRTHVYIPRRTRRSHKNSTPCREHCEGVKNPTFNVLREPCLSSGTCQIA
jgi:hypothetical protein